MSLVVPIHTVPQHSAPGHSRARQHGVCRGSSGQRGDLLVHWAAFLDLELPSDV